MKNLKNNFKSIDLPLLIAVISLSIIGVFLVASATNSFSNGKTQVIIQIFAIILGLLFCFALAFYDYEFLAKNYYFIIGINVFLLVLVLVLGIGSEEVGAKSWIRFGQIGIQPAEIVKIGFIISFAYQLAKYKDKINNIWVVLGCLAHIGTLIFFIMMQPDFGTAMVFIAVFLVMIYVAKISYKYIVGVALLCAAVLPTLWFFFFQEYQKNRIINFFHPDLDPQISGYHVIQSKTAIGSGKLFGQGLFNGILTQNELIPAKHTDFIFAVAGEELGFIGALVIVGIIIFIVARCYYIAYNAKDDLGTLIGIGVGTMILIQSFENIGMTIGLTPVTGITLPFLSYGGSSIVTNFLAIGLVLNVKMKQRRLGFN